MQREYKISLSQEFYSDVVYLSQYDSDYDVIFKVMNKLSAVDVDGKSAKFTGTRKDGLGFTFETTGTGSYVSFEINTSLTAVAGHHTAEIVFYDSQGLYFGSANVQVVVEPAARKDGTIDADTERAQEIAEEIQEIVDNAAAEVKGEAESWAVGERDGEPVPATDPAYNNNAKYYAQQAAQIAEDISGVTEQVAQNTSDIGDLKEDLSAMNTASVSDVGKALKAKTVSNGKVTEWEFGSTGSGQGLTNDQKLAILDCFQHVAWTDDQGQTYYDDLYDALFPPAELTSVSAVYVNSNPVYADTALDTLKQYITVTAHYSDSTTSIVTTYTLSGTLAVGTSTLIITYNGFTTTISVTVSESPKSDMDGWSDGVAYTDIDVVENSYYNAAGNPQGYNGWDRTGKIPCDGASTLLFRANGEGNIDKTYCWFFAEDESPLEQFASVPLKDGDVSVTVPSTAYYFGFSSVSRTVSAQLTQGVIPYA